MSRSFLAVHCKHLQDFAATELLGHVGGPNGLPYPFGILDERTALDNTISFWAHDVNPIQEAQIRTMWGRGSPLDQALASYIDPLEYLTYKHTDMTNVTKEESRAHLLTWEDKERDRLALRFHELADTSNGSEEASKARERLDD
ncbi:unnamed protein product [Aureobasidium vineae]|uniref:Uncharacterized protein n=1 Tax=Aureobasidium vineae TaxID=2773715 RepID=A0A9N8JD52_9PEZI|nr:unnamed protein product [Aureobasidium vineae]